MPGQPNSSLLRQLGASLLVARPTPGRVRRALRWVTPVAHGLVVTALILGPAQGAMGLLGAQAANAGRDDPMRRRIITLLVVGTATLAIQAIGLLIAPHPWLVPPVMTLITTISAITPTLTPATEINVIRLTNRFFRLPRR